jgi:mRNA interferase RelE/StbE
MSYQVLFTRRAERDFSAVPQRDRERLAKSIDALADDPRPHRVKKLEGPDPLYRLRAGDYRVLYTVEDNVVTVTVVRVGHRRDIYR